MIRSMHFPDLHPCPPSSCCTAMQEIMIQGGARPEEDVGQYGRSLAFRAESPVLPAAFR